MINFDKFFDSESIIKNAAEPRRFIDDNSKNRLSFGLAFLDEALLGIEKNDLVLLGGLSGGGKTELATHIAISNAQSGKRVVYFALEAEKKEIEMRIIYKLKSKEYFRSGGRDFTSYDRWAGGLCPHLDDVPVDIHLERGCLRTRYMSSTYSVNDFLTDYAEIVSSSDLVILDHIHYFDLETENENKEYKSIIKKIRSEVLENGKPMIVISHIKKRDRRFPSIVPDQEDFHGTSDLVKISTKVISLAPQGDFKLFKKTPVDYIELNEKYHTFMRIAKNRRNSSVCRYIAAVKFDHRINAYSKEYFLGSQQSIEKEVGFVVDQDTPFWASNCVN